MTAIYFLCVFGFHPVFLAHVLKPLEFPVIKAIKCVFCYVNEGDFWSSPKGGGAGRPLVARAANQVIRRLETLCLPLLFHLWGTERGEGQVEVASVQ